MRLAVRVAAGVGLMLASHAAFSACFCLIGDDRTPYYDCVEGVRGAARTPFVECRVESQALRQEIPGGAGMKRVPAGTPPCVPCETPAKVGHRAIRTGDDKADTKGAKGHE